MSSQENAWTRPNLSANGTIGGNSFACSADSSIYDVTKPYNAFNGNTTATGYADAMWHSGGNGYPHWICWYNPTPIKITKVTVYNAQSYGNYAIKGGALQASNDYSNWVELKSFTNTNTSNGGVWIIDCSNNIDFYNYYRIYISSGYNSAYVGVEEITMDAVYTTTATNSITYPQAFSTTNYAYSLAYLNGIFGESYATSKTKTGMTLQNNSNATAVYYTAIGY